VGDRGGAVVASGRLEQRQKKKKAREKAKKKIDMWV
jgi:hypothetical protein